MHMPTLIETIVPLKLILFLFTLVALGNFFFVMGFCLVGLVTQEELPYNLKSIIVFIHIMAW